MKQQTDLSAENLVEMSAAPWRRRLLGLLASVQRVPACEDGVDVFEIRREGGQTVLRKVRPSRAGRRADADAAFVRVRTPKRRGRLVFAEVTRHERGEPLDLVLDVSWFAADPKQFLRSYALERVRGGVPLTYQEVESWMAAEVSRSVRRAVRGRAVKDLRDGQALPRRWWQEQVTGWLAPFSIAVEVHAVRWLDATEARAEAQRRRAEDLARIADQRRLRRRAQQRRTQAEADYQAQRARIDADPNLSPQAKSRRRQQLEIRHRKRLYQAELAVEAAGAALARMALEHERAMADLRGDRAAAHRAEARRDQVEAEHHQAARRLAEAGLALDQLTQAAGSRALLAQLAGDDPRRAHQAAECLTSPQFGLSARQLAPLGFAVSTQALVEFLRDKAAADGHPVALTKHDVVPREIGQAEVRGLPLGGSLELELSARRAGFVALLNIGTSGAVSLHIPNAYVRRDKAKVRAGRAYLVPGRELLPPAALRRHGLSYVEAGPPGWEHMAVLVSDQPLIDAAVLARATHAAPLVKLSPDELDSLAARLADSPAATWTCGVVSFLVE